MAVIFILLAFILTIHVIGRFGEASGERILLWLLLIGLTALNLTALPVKLLDWRQGGRLGLFLNDEVTQSFRLKSYRAGFWMTILSTLIMMPIMTVYPVSGIDVARILVTIALVSALVTRAFLELQACR
ncbi:MAG TPA: hypothetical protein PKK10_17480 [Woeseiaceae bacterium]|nr:hypothetical protein [Woeseiaceae bacterium]